MNIPQEIVELLEDYLDGTLDQRGQETVSTWAVTSDEHARAVAEWFLAEAQLLEAARLADMHEVFERMPYARDQDDAAQTTAVRRLIQPSRMRRILTIAAAVALTLVASYLWLPGRQNRGAARSTAATHGKAAAAAAVPSPAILGRLSDCIWEDGVRPIRVGEDIAAGTSIDIKSGLAQIVFESGAEVVIKGPCRMQVDSSMLCRLFSGSVSAEVPHRAAGFTIRGPAAEVIDLGTRFGFSVGDAGNSEVHVFQGEVISRELDEKGEVVGKEIVLKKDQAILFPGSKKQAQRLAANEAKFALEVKPLWRNDKIEPLAVDRNIAMWLRAEHGVLTDRRNRVVAWQDLALGSNRVANDAFQPDFKCRPAYVLDGMGGKPAIRFDGASTYLTTIPITTTDDQTIVVVFQNATPATSGNQIGGQILNYNGPPSRYLPDVHSPGVLQLGEKIDSWSGPPGSIAAKAFVGRDNGGANVSTGVVVSDSLGYSQPRVATYVYSNSTNNASLYIDGKLADTSSAPTRVAVTSRKVIGKHGIFDQWYFHGDLAELVIFNDALSAQEVSSLSRQLLEHYKPAAGLPFSHS